MNRVEPNEPLLVVVRRGRGNAQLTYRNEGPQPVAFRTVPLEGLELRGPAGDLARSVSLRGRIAPGEAKSLRVHVRLDPLTPPGTYPGQLVMEGRTVPVTLVVPEERHIQMSPGKLKLEVAPGQELEHRLVVENRGNVPVVLRNPEGALLEPTDRYCTLLRRALARTDTNDYEELLNSVVGSARESYGTDLERRFEATLAEGPLELAPGAAAVVTLRWRVPDALDKGRYYRATVRLGGRRVRLEVHRPRSEHGGAS